MRPRFRIPAPPPPNRVPPPNRSARDYTGSDVALGVIIGALIGFVVSTTIFVLFLNRMEVTP